MFVKNELYFYKNEFAIIEFDFWFLLLQFIILNKSSHANKKELLIWYLESSRKL